MAEPFCEPTLRLGVPDLPDIACARCLSSEAVGATAMCIGDGESRHHIVHLVSSGSLGHRGPLGHRPVRNFSSARRRVPPPPQTKVTIVGKNEILQYGKSNRAIFGTQTFGSQTPLPPFSHSAAGTARPCHLCLSRDSNQVSLGWLSWNMTEVRSMFRHFARKGI